jgi:ribonuclease G
MAKNLLVISVELRETRVALIENGIIAELHLERGGAKQSTVGNVYLGKVTRVLPGLQAAFIDIGQERAAFLHVEDLIRPVDFEAYLAGGKRTDTSEEAATSGSDDDEADEGEGGGGGDALVVTPILAEGTSTDVSPNHETLLTEASPPEPRSSSVLIGAKGDFSGALPAGTHDDTSLQDLNDEPSLIEIPDAASSVQLAAPDSAPKGQVGFDESAADLSAVEGDKTDENEGDDSDGDEDDVTPTSDEDLFDMPGFTISEPGEPVPRAPAPRGGGGAGAGGRGGQRGRGPRGRRGRNGAERSGSDGNPQRSGGGDGRSSSSRGGGRSQRPNPMQANRISKTTPIRDVVQEGQEIIVQVTKDPISTKGARCSSHVSFPGRYVVYVPTVDHIGISKRIGSDRERARLRETIEAMKPPRGGLIVRTLAEGLTKKQLKQDVGYLVSLWAEIARRKEDAKAPALLSSELDIVLKVARDLFTDEVDQVVIDDKHQYERLVRFVEMFAPDRVKDVLFYTGAEPLFDAYGIEDEIQRALSRKVPLPSGGYLIIDQAEALTAIDVNTGRYVGKGAKDMEDAILKTNIEAVNEIAYQLRFRNIGGLIILDLIDMEKSGNREKVRRTLEELLVKDKAKTTLNRISDLGLIEMTRKRTRESLGRLLHEPCFYCDGTGQLQSKETIAYEILRKVKRMRADLPGYTIQISAHPAVIDLLSGSEKDAVTECENRYQRKISLVPRKDFHFEQIDIAGK